MSLRFARFGPGRRFAGLPYARGVRRYPVRLLLIALLVGACASSPAASFDPSGPCTQDGSAPGAYPELEALVPTSYEARRPERSTPGGTARAETLGALREAGIDEVRFAGGTWDFGGTGRRRSSCSRPPA